jgi:hypothetical protein
MTKAEQIERLERLITKREGQTGYADNVAHLKAELARLQSE